MRNLIIGVIIIAIVFVIFSCMYSFNDHTYQVTITDKERINQVKDSKYLVYCDEIDGRDDLVFQNTDLLLRGKFDSSNIQSSLKVGNTYEITVVGFRFPLFSKYENIISVKDIK